ncbi:aryl hydrocarbon receptor 1b [Coregonus clupeaformis]|uniref:aryl hydrocarbon receptor 1b n=1 Tax=Coregonus clupeaformis TaxID=59861 RepID=UPI001E1C3469|nr:aryl hydrocarbon receptor 1b [Coregonus clupeaformis]
MYAGRKRRKPVQRGIEVKDQKEKKTAPSEGTKSNPSKRHRDRLNSELDRLACLLPFPEEVTSSLDKLSILRLSVSYLRTKNFFSVALKTHACKGLKANGGNHDNSKTAGLVDGWMPEGELLLQALNGFVLVITAEGVIFYSSHTIQDYLGFHQTDVMHQSVFDLIHTEDQQEFRRNLHWALNPPAVSQQVESPPDGKPVPSSSLVTYNPDQLPPENSSFLERSFVCRFRCLLDNSSGFLNSEHSTFQGYLPHSDPYLPLPLPPPHPIPPLLRSPVVLSISPVQSVTMQSSGRLEAGDGRRGEEESKIGVLPNSVEVICAPSALYKLRPK